MKSTAIIGADDLSIQLACLTASHGHEVLLSDPNSEKLDDAKSRIESHFKRLDDKDIKPTSNATLASVKYSTTLDPNANVDVLFLSATLHGRADTADILAQCERLNGCLTVALMDHDSDIGSVTDQLPMHSQVVGLHIPQLTPSVQVVEVVEKDNADDSSADQLIEFTQSLGLTPVRAKNVPGFIVDRIALAMLTESMHVLADGIAGVDEVDSMLKDRMKISSGPFELMDNIGIDVILDVSRSISRKPETSDRLSPHPIAIGLVEKGHCGRRTKRGFYGEVENYLLPAYLVDRKSYAINPIMADAILALTVRLGIPYANATEQYAIGRIIVATINEAGHAFSENIALGGDIDVALNECGILPKGPLALADDVGHHTVAGVLHSLNDSLQCTRFSPSPLFARQ